MDYDFSNKRGDMDYSQAHGHLGMEDEQFQELALRFFDEVHPEFTPYPMEMLDDSRPTDIIPLALKGGSWRDPEGEPFDVSSEYYVEDSGVNTVDPAIYSLDEDEIINWIDYVFSAADDDLFNELQAFAEETDE